VARSWNLFFIARRRGDEDQLTEMLVWLASAVPAVRSALVELGLGIRVDPSEVTPSTQYGISGGRLDALLEGEGFRLAVESKLGSDYGPDQIGKYLRWLAVRKSSVANSGLMTLTQRPAPWAQEDVDYAQREELVASRRLWEDLHEILEPLIGDDNQESLPARMVQEFLEMLADENLVPTRPLGHADLGERWADSWGVVRRYGEFFRACTEAIAEALGATAFPNRWSVRGDIAYQDFGLPDTSQVAVGIFHTDEREPGSPRSRSPIVWVAVNADHLERWPAIADVLAISRPRGWREGNSWYGRPAMWRPLGDVIGQGTFEEQRSWLAAETAAAIQWLRDGIEQSAAAKGS
jgi:hypothetical protein